MSVTFYATNHFWHHYQKRKVLFSMIGINMCKVKNNHPSNQIFVYF